MKKILVIFLFFVFNASVFSQQIQLNPYFVSKAKYVNYFTKIPSPSIYRDHYSLSKIQTMNISANYIGTWPSEAQNAFNYALEIWSYLIKSTIPIKIKAEWVPLGEGILAETNSTSYKKNFTNAPVRDVNYPVSLAEALSGTELNGSEEEINIRVSSDFSWYYGLDGNTPSEKYDLVSVILHEVTHGLGFSHSMQIENNIGSWGQNYFNDNEKGFAKYYEKFGVVGPNSTTIYRLTNTNQYPNPSGELADALQSNNLYFDGTITKQMYLNNLPKLYAPNPFEGGSTLAHFDEDTFPAGNQNSLMSAQLGMAESIHSPGELGLAVLQDLGWNVNRLITILSPKAGLAYMPGQSKEIKWTDNIGGAISIDLLKQDAFGNYQYYSTIASHPSPRGVSDSINWTIPNVEGTFKIRMIDNTFSGEGFGLSYPFIISNQAQVATPVILPAGGNFLTAQTITISCATTGATIYYTTDNTDPSNSNGTRTEYSGAFSINSDMVITAIAIKSGFPDSETKSETYTFGTMPPPATVSHPSGEYPVPITIEVNWQSNVEGYVSYTNDGSEPIDPKTAGWNIPSNRPWRLTSPYENSVIKINARTKLNGVWGPLVQRTYYLKPALRIAQVDDEVNQGNNSFGFWNKWENNQWTPHPDETIVRPTQTSDWYIKALQDFKDPANNVFRKYNVWTVNGTNNFFVNHAKVPIGSTTSSVLAHFKQSYDVTVANKLENSFSVNQEGSFVFKNPWIVDDNSDSKGSRNRGDGTVVSLYPYTINFSTSPNITSGSIHKGVFLNQGWPSWQPPYYSVKANQTQSINLGGTIGTRDCYFQNWSADPSISASFQNSNSLETPVVFKSNGVKVQANYKVHLLSNSTSATTSNNQRKIVQGSNGYWAMVYVSMNQVWLSRSTDGVNWDREILISDYDNGYVNGYPSIDFYNDYTYIVWQSISWIGISGWNLCDINIRRYDLTNNILGPIITAASFEPNIEAFISAPVIAYPGGKDNEITIAWREPNGIKIKDGRGQLGADNITWSSTFNVPNTNAYSTNPSIAYACGYDFALCWAHSYGGNKIYYSTATKTYSPEWTFSNTAIISPSDWESNVSPQITVINRYKPTIVWTSRNNIVEGGPSVHIRQRSGLGTNDTWGTITSFSHPNSSSSLSPIIGDYYGLTKMEVLWNIGSTVYKASYNGTSWSGPTTLTTSGGSGVNINRTTAYQSKALWKKSDNTIAFYNVGGTTPPAKIVAGLENEESKLPYRLNRHAVIELSKDIDEQALGSVCFEIAGISTVYKEAETKINYSVDENNLLCSEPIKISAPGMQLSFAGAIYGSGLELPDKFISTLNEPLAKVVLKDSKANVVLQNIWTNNAAMLNQVQNKTFGEFRNVFIDLNKYLGKTVYVQVEMLGKAKDLKPLIVDDYLILTDSLSISKSLGKKNLTAYELPTDYTLMQNYPNPFNPVTTISFFIPQNNYVTLKIYNTLGEEVMTAINEDMEEGYHSVNLNLSAMPSGVYLYSLSAGSFRDTKKLLLLK